MGALGYSGFLQCVTVRKQNQWFEQKQFADFIDIFLAKNHYQGIRRRVPRKALHQCYVVRRHFDL